MRARREVANTMRISFSTITIQLTVVLPFAVDGRENGVFDVHKQCISQLQVTLGCPDDHLVSIKLAAYYRSKQQGCNTQDEERCLVK